ncbi:MAG: hypothetical protein KIIPBIDF_01687 [Candidatus Methanoperedenaceae archaeon GB50]|nr:MAG: hypothetical protein KIIPBIDF_01687 [Candidatus Methanoperedenaceae archaeon GB50]
MICLRSKNSRRFTNESEVKISLAEESMYNKDEVNIPKEILQKIKSKKTLIVVNQVKRAQRVYEEVKIDLG